MIAMTESAQKRTIRIGGASGFWGESSLATAQLLGDGALDYLVYDYLAENGVAEDRMSAEGFGEAQPIADNSTAAGKAQNRRVVLSVIED